MAVKVVKFHRDSKVAKIVTDYLHSSDMTLGEISEEMGLKNSSVLTQFKQGRSAVPFDRALQICQITGKPAAPLLKAMIEEYNPVMLEVFRVLTEEEVHKSAEKLVKIVSESVAELERERREEMAKAAKTESEHLRALSAQVRIDTSPAARKKTKAFIKENLIK